MFRGGGEGSKGNYYYTAPFAPTSKSCGQVGYDAIQFNTDDAKSDLTRRKLV